MKSVFGSGIGVMQFAGVVVVDVAKIHRRNSRGIRTADYFTSKTAQFKNSAAVKKCA